jgi:site-specific DNA-methyltransferase (adenine-specific)
MAVSITKRTLAGFRKDIHMNVKCYSKEIEVSDLVSAGVLKRDDEDMTKQGNTFYFNGKQKLNCDMITVLRAKPEAFRKDIVQGVDFWHVYNSIPKSEKEDINNMNFKAIVGNPPYQVMDGGNSASALPVYQHFVMVSKQLNPNYVSMITPSRWFAGGRGLDEYRDDMLSDSHMAKIIDFTDSKECFPTVTISGGINYFLWSKEHSGMCNIINILRGQKNEMQRSLNEYPVFVRSNLSINIIRKTHPTDKECLSSLVFPSNPFGFRTYVRGEALPFEDSLRFIHSEGIGYVARSEVSKCVEAIDTYNVIMTRAMSGGNKPNADGSYQIIPATMKVMNAGEICAETYICIGSFQKGIEATHLMNYLSTKFVRFLMLQSMTSIMINKDVFRFVPLQDFSKSWTDQELYKKYNLSDNEIDYIEKIIKPID